MAVLADAVEILDYVPPEPTNAVTLADRYVIVVDGARDQFAVFDTDSETSTAFAGCGVMASYGSPTGVRRNVVEHGGYAWTFGYVGSGSIIRIGSDGGVVTKPIPNASFSGLYFATVGISGGNLWYSTSVGGGRLGWVDLTTWTITEVAQGGSYAIVCTPTIVYQNGVKRWDGATGVALVDGPSLNLGNIGNQRVDNNILWGIFASSFREVDLTTGAAATHAAGIILTGGSVCHGPNNLIYAAQTASPYTGLAVIDKTTRTVGTWDFPTGRQQRYTLAYAAGQMWAFAGETP